MNISSSQPFLRAPSWRTASALVPSHLEETTRDLPTDGYLASGTPSTAAVYQPQSEVSDRPANTGAPAVEIGRVQEQLSAGLPGVGVKFLHTDEFAQLNGRLAKPGELKEMMAALYDESQIPYGYITDGCYARAHLMDESLRQHGINNAKMFCRGDLEAKNELMSARWWYHVAPLVFVDNGAGEAIPKIIDPGFSREPMDPEQWVKAMNQGPRVEIDLVDAEQYYPRRGVEEDSFSESLSPAVKTMQKYSHRLHGIKKAAGLPVEPFVTPTWDKPGSGGDFEVDGKTLFVFPSGVETHTEPAYRFDSASGILSLEPIPEREPVSAAWDQRPAGFDPYSTD